MAAGLRPTTHPGRPPTDRRASDVRGTRRRTTPRRRPAPSPRSACWSSWSSGPATSSSSRTRSRSCRRSGSRSCGTRWPSPTLLVLLRWREGTLRITPRELAPLALARRPRVRRLPDPVDGRAPPIPAGDSALLIAATPVLTALIAVAIGSDTLDPAEARRGRRLVRRRGRGHRRGRRGSSLPASPSGYRPDAARRGPVLGDLHAPFGGPVLRRPLARCVPTTWATVAGTLVPRVRSGSASCRAGRRRRRSASPSRARGHLLGCAGRGARERRGPQRVGLLGPTRVTTLQSLVPALAVVLAFIVPGRADPAGPGRRRRDHRQRRRAHADRRQHGRPASARLTRWPTSRAPRPDPAPRAGRAAARHPRRLRRHGRADRRVRHGHGRVRDRRLGGGGGRATTPG